MKDGVRYLIHVNDLIRHIFQPYFGQSNRITQRGLWLIQFLIIGSLCILLTPLYAQNTQRDTRTMLGFYTDTHAYIFDSQEEKWITGPVDGPVILNETSPRGYAFVTNQSLNVFDQYLQTWLQFEIEGNPVKLLMTEKNIGLLTSKFAYVFEFENKHLSEIFLGGQPIDMVHNSLGSYAVCTSEYAYVYKSAKELWFSKAISGDYSGAFGLPYSKPSKP